MFVSVCRHLPMHGISNAVSPYWGCWPLSFCMHVKVCRVLTRQHIFVDFKTVWPQFCSKSGPWRKPSPQDPTKGHVGHPKKRKRSEKPLSWRPFWETFQHYYRCVCCKFFRCAPRWSFFRCGCQTRSQTRAFWEALSRLFGIRPNLWKSCSRVGSGQVQRVGGSPKSTYFPNFFVCANREPL